MRKKDPGMIIPCRLKKKNPLYGWKNKQLLHITASLQAVRDTVKVVITDSTWIRSGLLFSVALVINQQWWWLFSNDPF